MSLSISSSTNLFPKSSRKYQLDSLAKQHELTYSRRKCLQDKRNIFWTDWNDFFPSKHDFLKWKWKWIFFLLRMFNFLFTSIFQNDVILLAAFNAVCCMMLNFLFLKMLNNFFFILFVFIFLLLIQHLSSNFYHSFWFIVCQLICACGNVINIL